MIQKLFKSKSACFQKADLQIYGCEKEVYFLSKIYLWDQKLYQPLQFVLAGYDGKQIILAGTGLPMTPEDIITAYACRFKIEAMFQEMKQQPGAFFYHFWTKAAPKLNRYSKKGSPDPLNKITDKSKQTKIIEAVTAILRRNLFCFMAKQKQITITKIILNK